MKFSEKWLREWVDPSLSTEQLAHQLTMAGLEVDAVEAVAPAFSGVVVGQVTQVEPHPDADKLRVCRVEVGTNEPLRIVCGASNVRVGMRVPTALVGAELPGGMKIKKAKLRGVESFGMLCSAKELGLAESADGLMELPGDSVVGVDIRALMELDDFSIELGLTPNRGDCLSIAGIAREVGVLNQCPVGQPAIPEVAPGSDERFPVTVEAAAECPHYVGRVISGIDAGAATPLWMQERLRRSGIRSLGPVVDVTNYVMLELGQPMHAFDLAKLTGGIKVRHARQGEKLALLNGSEVELDGDALVIADDSGPLALAGVMGGEASAVGEATRDIFLESAYFSPMVIAGRARRFGLHTDSSHRFERGVSPQLQGLAVERATALLLEIVGGRAGPVVKVCYPAYLPEREPIALRHGRIERVLGADVPADRIVDILTRLGMALEAVGDDWAVTPPAYRFDLTIEEDLIEEVGRIYGYERVPSHAPAATLIMSPRPERQVPLSVLRHILVDRGYQEAITYSFVDPKLQALLDPEGDGVALANPISSEMSVMRTSLWPGLVQALLYNLNRQQSRIRIFESGLKFSKQHSEIKQEKMMAGVVFGSRFEEQWGVPASPVDFYDAKGDVEALLGILGEDDGPVLFEAGSHPALHPGQCARILRGGEVIGWLGALHPRLERTLGLSAQVFLFELRLDAFESAKLPRFRELSKFPAIRRDIAIVVDEGVTARQITDCTLRAAPDLMQDLQLFDVYTGKGIDSGRKSIALGLTLQAYSRTLKDSEVDAAVECIVAALKGELGATLRE